MYAVQKDHLEIVTNLVDTGVLEFSKTNKASTNNIIIGSHSHKRKIAGADASVEAPKLSY